MVWPHIKTKGQQLQKRFIPSNIMTHRSPEGARIDLLKPSCWPLLRNASSTLNYSGTWRKTQGDNGEPRRNLRAWNKEGFGREKTGVSGREDHECVL